MTRWYDGIAPATALIPCGGGLHPVSWRRGRVVAEAHDIGSEQALTALGAVRCPCVEVVAICRTGMGVEDLFPLWTEHAEPSVGTSQALERWSRRVGLPSGARGSLGARGRLAEERRTAVLASLPLAFRRRLALGIFRSIGRERERDLSASHPGFEPIFSSLLLGAARAAGLGAAGLGAADPGAGRRSGGARELHCRLAPAGMPAAVEVRSRSIELRVSAGWVADVWAWGLATVEGHLVLDASRHWSADDVTVRLVSSAPGCVPTLLPTRVRRVGPDWTLPTSRAVLRRAQG